MIETQRLILRPFEAGDAEDLYDYLHLPQVHCFACMQLNAKEDAVQALEERMRNGEYCLAIVDKKSGKVIGEIEAYPESVAPGEAPEDTFSLCWMLHPAWQGKGLALEAAQAFFDHLFEHKGARRIYAYTEEDNLPSQRLCERLGMRREGMFMEFVSFVKDDQGNPIYENTIQYAILKREWQTR